MEEGLTVGQKEKKTQDRIVKLFKDKLDYTYLGNWEERENSNLEEELLIKFLKRQKYSDVLIKKAVDELKKVSSNQNKSLYDINKEVYSLLRYGVKVKETVGENRQTVHIINWDKPLENDFYIAEEVTVKGKNNTTNYGRKRYGRAKICGDQHSREVLSEMERRHRHKAQIR